MSLKDVKNGKVLDTASSFQTLCNLTAEKPVEHVDFYLVSHIIQSLPLRNINLKIYAKQ